jgi:HEAT repeat protein
MPDKTPALPVVVARSGVSARPVVNTAAVSKAFAALQTYDRGSSRASLMPIDDVVVASLDDALLRRELERRLAAVLRTKVSPVAKEYVCSKLGLIGSAESVPALAEFLADRNLAHVVQSALESMPCPEAAQAIRDGLPRLGGLEKVGAIHCLAVRRDAQSVSVLATLLADSDNLVRLAALAALGNIGTKEAAQSLQGFRPNAADSIHLAVADALLACAERLLSAGKKTESLAIYKSLTDSRQPKHIRLAANRGLMTAQKL